jgi:hypothetical protein
MDAVKALPQFQSPELPFRYASYPMRLDMKRAVWTVPGTLGYQLGSYIGARSNTFSIGQGIAQYDVASRGADGGAGSLMSVGSTRNMKGNEYYTSRTWSATLTTGEGEEAVTETYSGTETVTFTDGEVTRVYTGDGYPPYYSETTSETTINFITWKREGEGTDEDPFYWSKKVIGSSSMSGALNVSNFIGVANHVLGTNDSNLNSIFATSARCGEKEGPIFASVCVMNGYNLSVGNPNATIPHYPWTGPFTAKVCVLTRKNFPAPSGNNNPFDGITRNSSPPTPDPFTFWSSNGEKSVELRGHITANRFKDKHGLFDPVPEALEGISWTVGNINDLLNISLDTEPGVYSVSIVKGFFKSANVMRYRLTVEAVQMDDFLGSYSVVDSQQVIADVAGVEFGYNAPFDVPWDYYTHLAVIISKVEKETTGGWEEMVLPTVIPWWLDPNDIDPDYSPYKDAASWGWVWNDEGEAIEMPPLVGSDPQTHPIVFLKRERFGQRWGFRGFNVNGEQSTNWYRQKVYLTKLSV